MPLLFLGKGKDMEVSEENRKMVEPEFTEKEIGVRRYTAYEIISRNLIKQIASVRAVNASYAAEAMFKGQRFGFMRRSKKRSCVDDFGTLYMEKGRRILIATGAEEAEIKDLGVEVQ